MAETRKSARQRGKSDGIDAINVARAALREGLATCPAAHLDGPELDLRLLVDHRERLMIHRGEIAGGQRFATDAKLARAAGAAPVPASSGNTRRQRLGRGGNRQINAALHRVIVTRARCHRPTRDYIQRRRRERKTTRDAIRCLLGPNYRSWPQGSPRRIFICARDLTSRFADPRGYGVAPSASPTRVKHASRC